MAEYRFGLSKEQLTRRQRQMRMNLATRHGCSFHYMPKGQTGPVKSWFATKDHGEAINASVCETVLAELKELEP